MRKLKLLFELVFIFILPLIFMCFYLNIETVYTYDSDGNYQDSSKQITFDSIEIVNEVSNVHHGIEYIYYTEEEFNQLDQLVPSNFSFNVYDVLNYFNNSLSIDSDLIVCDFGGQTILLNSFDRMFFYSYTQIIYPRICNNNNNAYCVTLKQSFYNNCFVCQDFGEGTYTFNFYPNIWIKDIVEVDENHYKNPLYDGLVKIEDLVGINTDSIIVEFINTYNCLWILMFAFWHLLYAFFELMVHIFDPKKYQIE